MAENLYNSAHKANSDAYRKGWTKIFGKYNKSRRKETINVRCEKEETSVISKPLRLEDIKIGE